MPVDWLHAFVDLLGMATFRKYPPGKFPVKPSPNEITIFADHLGSLKSLDGTSGEHSELFPAKADQATAEAGTNDTAYMTPLRTAQAIDAQLPSGTAGKLVLQAETEAEARSAIDAVGLYGDETIAGNKTFSGNLAVNGNTTLGDAAGDQVVINAGSLIAPNATAAGPNNLTRTGTLDQRYFQLFIPGAELINRASIGGNITVASPSAQWGNTSGASFPNSIANKVSLEIPNWVGSVRVRSWWGPRGLSASTGNIAVWSKQYNREVPMSGNNTAITSETSLQGTVVQSLVEIQTGISYLVLCDQTVPPPAVTTGLRYVELQRRGSDSSDTWEEAVVCWGILLTTE